MKNKTRSRIRNLLVFCLTVGGIVGILAYPEISCDAAEKGIEISLSVLIPTLFPFLVLSGVFIKFGFAEKLGRLAGGFTKKIFCVGGNCSCAMVLGLISGFPVGAKTVATLYKDGACTKTDAERTLAFCNNAGPSFILGTVGVGIWQSGKTGWLLWGVQVISSVLVGVCVGRIWKGTDTESPVSKTEKFEKAEKKTFLRIFLTSVTDGAVSVLYICAFVIFFAVVVSLLLHTGIIPLTAGFLCKLFPFFDREAVENVLVGVFEMTTGVGRIGSSAPILQNLALTSAVIGWAGISVHCQVLSYICDGGLSPKPYFLGKVLQTAFATALTFAFSFLFSDSSVETAFLSEKLREVPFEILVFGFVVVASAVVLVLLVRDSKQTEKTVKFSQKP